MLGIWELFVLYSLFFRKYQSALKGQFMETIKRAVVARGSRERREEGWMGGAHGGFHGRETMLYDALTVDTCHCQGPWNVQHKG